MLKRTAIKRKHCKCSPDCKLYPTMSCEGYAYSHLPADVKERVGAKNRIRIKNRNKRTALSAKLHKVQNEVEGSAKNELELFFMLAAQELANKPYCEECGAWIPPKFYRAATAHVMPKKKEFGFPSIASNPINRIFLGAGCGCHSKYDSNWDNASKMNIWEKAVEKFKELYPFIAERELKNIPEQLLSRLNN